MVANRRAAAAAYFPGMPEGFPTRGDFRVMKALAKMTWMLHGFAEPSSRCAGHRDRLKAHRQRIRDCLGGLCRGRRARCPQDRGVAC
jgi:hypothetical protein